MGEFSRTANDYDFLDTHLLRISHGDHCTVKIEGNGYLGHESRAFVIGSLTTHSLEFQAVVDHLAKKLNGVIVVHDIENAESSVIDSANG